MAFRTWPWLTAADFVEYSSPNWRCWLNYKRRKIWCSCFFVVGNGCSNGWLSAFRVRQNVTTVSRILRSPWPTVIGSVFTDVWSRLSMNKLVFMSLVNGICRWAWWNSGFLYNSAFVTENTVFRKPSNTSCHDSEVINGLEQFLTGLMTFLLPSRTVSNNWRKLSGPLICIFSAYCKDNFIIIPWLSILSYSSFCTMAKLCCSLLTLLAYSWGTTVYLSSPHPNFSEGESPTWWKSGNSVVSCSA